MSPDKDFLRPPQRSMFCLPLGWGRLVVGMFLEKIQNVLSRGKKYKHSSAVEENTLPGCAGPIDVPIPPFPCITSWFSSALPILSCRRENLAPEMCCREQLWGERKSRRSCQGFGASLCHQEGVLQSLHVPGWWTQNVHLLSVGWDLCSIQNRDRNASNPWWCCWDPRQETAETLGLNVKSWSSREGGVLQTSESWSGSQEFPWVSPVRQFSTLWEEWSVKGDRP